MPGSQGSTGRQGQGGFSYAVANERAVHDVNIGDSKDELLSPHIEVDDGVIPILDYCCTSSYDCGCLQGLVQFQEQHLRAGINVLVHCGAGISRAGAAVIAYLMWKQKINYDEVATLQFACLPLLHCLCLCRAWMQALEIARTARHWIRPNAGFAKQLQDYNYSSIAVP